MNLLNSSEQINPAVLIPLVFLSLSLCLCVPTGLNILGQADQRGPLSSLTLPVQQTWSQDPATRRLFYLLSSWFVEVMHRRKTGSVCGGDNADQFSQRKAASRHRVVLMIKQIAEALSFLYALLQRCSQTGSGGDFNARHSQPNKSEFR